MKNHLNPIKMQAVTLTPSKVNINIKLTNNHLSHKAANPSGCC